MAVRAKRYPLRPLAAAMRIDLPGTGNSSSDEGVRALAKLLDVTERTIGRWLLEGVPEDRTDAYACHLANMHPMSIWPDWSWLDDAVDELNRADENDAAGWPLETSCWDPLQGSCPRVAA